jgi:hypothetical protein
VHCLSSNTIISGCLIYKNVLADEAGGIMASEDCIVTLRNNTIAYNSTKTLCGGIATKYGATFTGTNNIIYANISSDNHEIGIIEGGNIKLTYSCISHKTDGKGNIFTDPLFINPKKDDFRLKSNSPCINAGNPNSYREQGNISTNMGAL